MDDQPSPPANPLFDGVYDFFLRPANIRVFIACWICMTLLCVLAGFGYYIKGLIAELPPEPEKFGLFIIGLRAIGAMALAVVVLAFFSSIYPSACFMRIIESTGAGEDQVQWSQGVWFEFVKDFAYIVWTFFCSTGVPGLCLALVSLKVPVPSLTWWIVLVATTLILFPVFLLSMLIANSPWALLHVRVIERLLERPSLSAAVYINGVAFGVPSAFLAYWIVTGYHFLFAPVAGAMYAAYWITYARLLGRVGWMMTEHEKRTKKKKKRKVRVEEDFDD
jgi:hypothetical protein